MLGRMAEAMITPRKISAITSFSFQRASARATIPRTTSVATATCLAVSFMTRDFSPWDEGGKPDGPLSHRRDSPRRAAACRRAGRAVPAGARARGGRRLRLRARLAAERGRHGDADPGGPDRRSRGLALGADARRA